MTDWFVNRGGQGLGPLTVPAPVVGVYRPGASAGWSATPTAGHSGDTYTPYAKEAYLQDPIGSQLGLSKKDPGPPDVVIGGGLTGWENPKYDPRKK